MAQIQASGIGLIRSIRDFEFHNKTVFMRVDFNVPLSEPDANGVRTIEEDLRIREALPSIQHVIAKGGRLILASHLGRPDGKADPKYSLEPVAAHLATLLGQDVTLADDCVGDGIHMMVKSLTAGQVLLLENLRFHADEEKNDLGFARKLASLAEIYINDAFGTSHRKHASVYGVPNLIPQRGMGFLIEKELKYFDPLIHQPAKPFMAILGGSKVTDKIQVITTLIRHLDGMVVGGAMAHAFWLATGRTLPEKAKQPKPEDVEAAKNILADAKKRDIPVLLPTDTNEGFDIGPETVKQFGDFLSRAKTIFWNGPMGWFEKDEYARGTFDLAALVAEVQAVKVVGGGDTVSAIRKSGLSEKFDHLSTGGGAVLEYLEGNGLPGIDALKTVGKSSMASSPSLTGSFED